MTTYADGKCRNSARRMADGRPNMGDSLAADVQFGVPAVG